MGYDKDKVREAIEPEDVFNLLEFFGGEPKMFSDYIISRTICHNGDSHKLYYYFDSKLFKCYTHCNPSTFDVFQLVQKVRGIDDLNAAVSFAVNFFNLQDQIDSDVTYEDTYDDWKLFDSYERDSEKKHDTSGIITFPECDLNVISHYPQPRIPEWESAGITKDICDFAGIRYDPVGCNILIPHFDADGRCIGIRQRTLIQEQEQYGKYRPWTHDGKLYNHPLAFNLYGLNWAKDRISEMGTAIVVEAEKSVLSFMSYFGTENDICVATCGSSISKYQFNMLMNLGISELVIAFDHDFLSADDDGRKRTEEKIAGVANRFKSYTNVSVLFDREGILNYKASPLDQGRETFNYLFRNRIML